MTTDHSRLHLLPGWADALAAEEAVRTANKATVPEPTAMRLIVPKSATFYASRTTVITTVEQATAFVEFAATQPICHIGIDSEFRFARTCGKIAKGGRSTMSAASNRC